MPGFIDDIEDYVRQKLGLGNAQDPTGEGGRNREKKITEAVDEAVTGVPSSGRGAQSSDAANGYGGGG